MVLILILSIIGICLLFTQIKSVDPSESPLLSCCAIIILIYLFSLIGFLNIGVFFVVIFGICAIPLSLILKRNNLKEFLKQLLQPGFLLFIFFLIILYPICKPIVTGAWDEYSHWALIVRNMLYTNALPETGSAVLYMSYPPATSLFQYLFMKFTGGVEGMMYYAQAILLASCISVLLKGQSFKKPWYLLLALIIPLAVMVKFSIHNIFNIFTDTIMAVIAVSCFAMYYTSKKKYSDMLKLIPILFVLCLIRINAISFAGIVILLVGIDQVSSKGIKDIKMWAQVLSLFTALILSFGSWQIHLSIMNVKSIETQLFPVDMARLSLTISNYLKAMYTQVLGNANPLMTIFSTMSYTLSIFIYLLILIIIMQFVLRNKKPVLKSFNIMNIVFFVGWVLYGITLIYTYMYTFTELEGTTVASFSRYVSTYFIFWIIGISYMMITILSSDDFKKSRKKTILNILCILLVLALIGLSNPFKLNIIGDRRLENVYEQEAIDCAAEIQISVGKTAKVYMIFQKSRGYTFMGTRYQLGTNPTNLGTWSLGKPYSEADTWTVDIPPQELLDRLIALEYEFVYVGGADDQLWNNYGMLFDMPNSEYKVFKVCPNAEYPLVAVK